MSDNVTLPGDGATVSTDDVGGKHFQRVKLDVGGDGVSVPVTDTAPLPVAVTFPATQPVSGTFFQATQPVSGVFWQSTQPVSGPLTDAQLRASALPVSAASLPLPAGAATNAILTDGTQKTKLTDGTNTVGVTDSSTAASETASDRLKVMAALRLLDTAQAAGSQMVAAKGDQTSGMWVNVKAAPTTAVTGTFWQTTQPVSGTFWQGTQPVSATALPLPTGAATEATLANVATQTTLAALNTATGAQADSAASTDAGTFSLTALIKRLLGKLPLALGAATSANSLAVVIASDQPTVPVSQPAASASGTITTQNLVPAGAATASSAVEITLGGAVSLSIQVTGTYTGALSLQATLDGSTWVTMGGVPLLNVNTGGYLATITSALQSVFQADVGAFLKARVTALAAVTGTATVTLKGVTNPSMMALDAAIPAGANTIGAVNIAASQTLATVTTVGTVSSMTPVTPTTSFVNSAATTNATSTKASAGTLWSVTANNINAAARYLKLYNKASAPTVGTDVPVLTIPIPAGGIAQVDGGSNGVRFATGIAWALTTAAADSDTGAVAANEHKVALAYT